ncbi:tumor necrosis factor receptor superfamily member 6 [Parambassis ranga]|uniref:Tumor necrosis factor receptor superfamily member 6 n=1 Tax=Parambassis ranga TaxID=210632 RepID=A0A6P7JT73_9TELE|nr:tumor necrosis factor receptor superfamily member 6-like [Parambassis ranga]
MRMRNPQQQQQQQGGLNSVCDEQCRCRMAPDRSTLSAWTIIVLFFVAASLTSASSRVHLRGKRQAGCQDGSYTHEGRTCCMCAAGLRLVKHCTATSPNDGKCSICEPNTYNSLPNYKETCEPCKSCSQPSANMEVAEPCTAARNTKCRCKTGYYCSSDTDCIACHPCKECGDAGVKTACNATSDAVCNDESQANHTAIIVSVVIIIIIFAIAFAGALYLFFRKRQHSNEPQPAEQVDPLLPQLKGLELQPLLPDLAEVLGWKTMKEVAMRTGMLNTAIESCRQNHPGNAQEQTLELLSTWVERQGREAPEKLITTLHTSRERMKEERVRKIFSDKLDDKV